MSEVKKLQDMTHEEIFKLVQNLYIGASRFLQGELNRYDLADKNEGQQAWLIKSRVINVLFQTHYGVAISVTNSKVKEVEREIK